jgi:hypothetical protein
MASWVLLAYRLPREPSRPRLALWRTLRRLGAAQVSDGLVALPLNAETREQVEWLASGVVDDGGDASVWIAEAATRAQDRTWTDRIKAAVADECAALSSRVGEAAGQPSGDRRRALRALRSELERIRGRDYFGVVASTGVAQSIEALAGEADEVRTR